MEMIAITKFQLILEGTFLETTRVVGHRSRTKGDCHKPPELRKIWGKEKKKPHHGRLWGIKMEWRWRAWRYEAIGHNIDSFVKLET